MRSGRFCSPAGLKPTLRLAVAIAAGAAFQCSCTGPAAAPGSAQTAVLFDDFESGRGGVWTQMARDPRLSIARDQGVGGGRALQATYVGGHMGSERLVRTIPLGTRGTEYTLSYDVKFGKDFQFVRGGKLHGLGPEQIRRVPGGPDQRLSPARAETSVD